MGELCAVCEVFRSDCPASEAELDLPCSHADQDLRACCSCELHGRCCSRELPGPCCQVAPDCPPPFWQHHQHSQCINMSNSSLGVWPLPRRPASFLIPGCGEMPQTMEEEALARLPESSRSGKRCPTVPGPELMTVCHP